jgi:hypothetical protein
LLEGNDTQEIMARCSAAAHSIIAVLECDGASIDPSLANMYFSPENSPFKKEIAG